LKALKSLRKYRRDNQMPKMEIDDLFLLRLKWYTCSVESSNSEYNICNALKKRLKIPKG